MRLTSIALTRYGNYEGERIRFDPTPGAVNLLWAPNSSGKSVLRQAVTDLLFGIHHQTPMGFRYNYSGMRISASAIGSDGVEIAFSRLKARGNPLEDGAGQTLDPTFLDGVLKGRDKTLLERLFVLDTDALRAGGKALLESGGDVASALLSAAGGIRQARALKTRLERQRDDLAPLRKTGSRPFYQALDQFMAARARARAETLKPDDWFRQQRDLEVLEETRAARNAEAEAEAAETQRLNRIRTVRPWLAQRDEAVSWLDRHPDAPRLDTNLRAALDGARTEATTREEAARAARDVLSRAEQAADEVVVDEALLTLSDDISGLVRDSGQARKARDDHATVKSQYANTMARIGDFLRQLGAVMPAERAAEILPMRALVTRTRQRIKEHAGIEAGVAQSKAMIAGRGAEQSDLERDLAALPPAMDVDAVALLLTEIRASGDPATTRAEAEKILISAEAALAAAAARVPSWTAGAEALAALNPPAIDLWRRLDTDTATARNEMTAARQRMDEESQILAHAREALMALAAGGPVADTATLQRARSHRDTGWRLIYRRAFTDSPPSPDDENSFNPDMPLPLAFERAMAAADAIADERAADSDGLARIEAARRLVAEAEQRVEATVERVRIAEEKLAQARRAWGQMLTPFSLPEDSGFSDLQSFLNARERIVDAMERRSLAAGVLAALDRRHTAWAAELARTLAVNAGTLPALLAKADNTLTLAAQRQRARQDLETRRTRAAKETRDAEAAQTAALTAREAWRERWRTVLAELGRPVDEEPGETEAVLQIFGDMEKEHTTASSLAQRLRGMENDLARFTATLAKTAALLPAVKLPDDPFQAVRELDRLLTAERARQARQRVLREALEAARANDASTTLAFTTARACLAAVFETIGSETIEQAQARLALSAERARFEAMRDSAEARLREDGDGFSLDALRAEVAGSPAEAHAAAIEAANTRRKTAVEAAQRATEEAASLRQALERKAEETGAIAAATDQQAALASLSSTLDEALVYHTAALLLGRALEAVEKSGDLAMFRRLGEIFAQLTCGAHTRVTTELDDSGKAGFGFVQRDFPELRQSIDQLSEGTRDQFFLALRVAAIETHLATAPPLPFIGDDILQTFDDDRALAALRVLSELSQRTQVIVLTHHRHLLDVAARLPEGTVFQCPKEAAA